MQTIPDRGGEDAAGVVTAGGVPAAMITASRKGRARVPARFQSYRVGVKNDDPFVIAGEMGGAVQEKRGEKTLLYLAGLKRLRHGMSP